LFYCFEAKIGGDCLALVQHITGLEVQDAAHFLAPKEATVPQAGRAETTAPKNEFDPAVFAQKLVFSPEVSALGISEEDATRLGIGFHPQRKTVYFPQKDETGFIAGFIAFKDGKLVMPPKWLEHQGCETQTCLGGLRASFLLFVHPSCGRSRGCRRSRHLRAISRRRRGRPGILPRRGCIRRPDRGWIGTH